MPDQPSSANVKEELEDFVETHCHWQGCDKEFHTQEHLVKVRATTSLVEIIVENCRQPNATE